MARGVNQLFLLGPFSIATLNYQRGGMEIAKLGQFRCSFHICGRLATRHGKSLVLNLSGAQDLLGCVLADFEMLEIKIGLPNGRSEKIRVPLSSKVGDLKLLALDLSLQGVRC